MPNITLVNIQCQIRLDRLAYAYVARLHYKSFFSLWNNSIIVLHLLIITVFVLKRGMGLRVLGKLNVKLSWRLTKWFVLLCICWPVSH